MHKIFRYSKSIQTTDIEYPVTLTISGNTVHCYCERVTGIPGTNNGNVTMKVNIGFGGNNGSSDSIDFEWKIKDGITEYKHINIFDPIYMGSGFTTRSSWQVTNSDGNITYYRFVLRIK